MALALHEPDVFLSKFPPSHRCTERWIKHYSTFHKILLVGEGDFSFSSALANAFGCACNMVATSLDSEAKVIRLYKSARITLWNLKRRGAIVLHGVDATTMGITIGNLFDRIVYNFPHAGFCGKEDEEAVIEKHRRLLKMFFKNAKTMLSGIGEIHVTHKEKSPYNRWKLEEQAQKCGLVLKESVTFDLADYPGYINRRGDGLDIGNTFFLGSCKTYKFIPGPSCFDLLHLLRIKPNWLWTAPNPHRDTRPATPVFISEHFFPRSRFLRMAPKRRREQSEEEEFFRLLKRQREEPAANLRLNIPNAQFFNGQASRQQHSYFPSILAAAARKRSVIRRFRTPSIRLPSTTNGVRFALP
eukprot:Gb_17756 [translate_table: standard]